jgi:8-oxo-dGTP diphosphatase
MEQSIPVFGRRNEELPQKTRACAYVVATNGEGLVAAARESDRLYLPGGGIELIESPIEAIHREVKEELGCGVALAQRVGQAVKYFEKDGACYALYATFYAGELGEKIAATCETHLEWVRPEDLFHEHHAWAARKRLSQTAETMNRR